MNPTQTTLGSRESKDGNGKGIKFACIRDEGRKKERCTDSESLFTQTLYLTSKS